MTSKYKTLLANISEIKTFLEAHGKFTRQANAMLYAENRYSQYSIDDLKAFLPNFRVVVAGEGEQMIAGCHILASAYLVDIFFDDKESFSMLLKELQKENISHRIFFGSFTPSQRDFMAEVLEELAYARDVNYELSSSLIKYATTRTSNNVISWQAGLDKQFFEVYQKYNSFSTDWEETKEYGGGGEFSPDHWFTDSEYKAIIGANQPEYSRTEDAIYNIIVAEGETKDLQILLEHSLAKMSGQSPTGFVNAYVNQSKSSLFKEQGFKVVAQTPLYSYLKK